jgi:hippurate hydrolase
VLKNGSGPTILVRTDLDALPVKEQTGLTFASTVIAQDAAGIEVPVMHACGHDVNMTCLVGTARVLSNLKDLWSGTLILIGQPAEERGAGAIAMLDDGLFKKFPVPDFALALHINADMPAGTIGYTPGFAMANVDSVDITIPGVGGHGAYPHTTRDPVTLAAYVITELQTLVSRTVSPLQPAVVTVGSIHGGAKHNVIPDEVKLQLTVRSYEDSVRAALLDGIERIVMAQAAAFDLPQDRMPTVTVKDEYTPSLYNDPDLLQRLLPVLQTQFGPDRLIAVEPVMAGEDFGRFSRDDADIAGQLFWLGVVDPALVAAAAAKGEPLPSLHSARMAPLPQPAITTGVELMTRAALTLLQKP